MLLLIVAIPFVMVSSEELTPNNQLLYFKNRVKVPDGILTTQNGAPVCYKDARSTLNTNLMSNDHYNQRQAHLHRERIPERFVHAKGNGAFGYFEVTNKVSHICEADFLSEIGKQTPIVVRFSQATGEKGIPELNQDLRSVSIRFYTDEGNFDIPGFNIPIFFGNDPIIFHTMVHAIRRNPSTNLFDSNSIWDAITRYPEALFAFLYILSEYGIPATYQNTPGFGVHTYQLHNASGDLFFVKFHMMPDAGIKGLSPAEAAEIGDPDHLTRSLYQAIQNGEYPSWTVSVQILTESQVLRIGSDAIDVSKIIPLDEYPLHKIGKIILNRNPTNFHAEIEQLAFCPSNLVNGVDGGLGIVFEARRVGYKDAQHYRLGANFDKITVNTPLNTRAYTYNRDGMPPVANNEGDAPNYYPNSFNGPVPCECENRRELLRIIETKANNTEQASKFYTDELNSDGRTLLVQNLISNLKRVSIQFIRDRAITLLRNTNADLGNRVSKGLNQRYVYDYLYRSCVLLVQARREKHTVEEYFNDK